ncbi:MAG TPA: S46 family peptidase, partial [Wenzhouxiangella sp.]|nr:S46 family peptidase [Wenzhouxiangella sp.]
MRITLPLILAGVAFATGAVAVEGMWQPAQLPGIAPQLEQAGLEIKPEELSDLTAYPMGSIVSLGGCTASLVSDKGLIVTNHHCAYGALAYNSTPEENLIVDGFLAESPDEERPASPGMRVYVTESIDDVTDSVLAGVDEDMSGAARYKAIEKARKSLVGECEETPGYNCRVASFYGGLSYQLVRQLEIRDVRVVYAPPESIGKFGGDIDNWVWPRHTGDFSFLRAYVAPDGSPAGYAEENVPFQPRHVMQLNPKGLEAGDFVMVAGYPGRTNRYRLASEVEHALGWNYPNQIRLFEETLEIIADAAAENPDAGVKYASR